MTPGERYCTEAFDDDRRVVYHLRPIPLSTDGWGCLACGEATRAPVGDA